MPGTLDHYQSSWSYQNHQPWRFVTVFTFTSSLNLNREDFVDPSHLHFVKVVTLVFQVLLDLMGSQHP